MKKMKDNEILVKVEHLSKSFAKTLRLVYGMELKTCATIYWEIKNKGFYAQMNFGL